MYKKFYVFYVFDGKRGKPPSGRALKEERKAAIGMFLKLLQLYELLYRSFERACTIAVGCEAFAATLPPPVVANAALPKF